MNVLIEELCKNGGSDTLDRHSAAQASVAYGIFMRALL
jgi:hypothetical protein